MIIRLGIPNNKIPAECLTPALLLVQRVADFSELPENPNWKEISHLALLIDGYGLAKSFLCVNDLFEWFNPIWEGYLERNAPLPTDSLRLWLMLFACQRGYLKDVWTYENADGSPSEIALGITALYHAFRRAIAEEARNPKPDTVTYLPDV